MGFTPQPPKGGVGAALLFKSLLFKVPFRGFRGFIEDERI
jgi:hypothetical protein